MTFATKVLPGPSLSPLGDDPDPPVPGPEPVPSRDQTVGKKRDGKLSSVAGRGPGSTDQEGLKITEAMVSCPRY